MADFGAPVAQNVNVSPAQGLQTISGLLGIQQQQQQLQTQTAQAQQAQQENQEKQALAQFTRMAVQDPKFRNSDGSLNVQKFQNGAQAAAPVYGQAYIGQATQNANSMIANREALLSLSNQQRATSGNYFAAVAANPNATRDDFLDAAEQARSVSDDPAYQRSIDRMLMSAPDVRALPTSQASLAIRQWARGIALETAAPGATESAPQTATMQGPQGLQTIQTSPQSPLGIGTQGPPMRQGVAPGGGIVTDAYGRQYRYDPQTNTVTPIGTGTIPQGPARPNGAAPSAGGAGFQQPVASQPQVLSDLETARAVGDQGPAARNVNSQLLQLSEQTRTGPATAAVQKLAAALNLPSGSRYQEISAYLDRQSAMAARTMGVPNTNAGLAAAQTATGTNEYTPAALKEKVEFADALNSGAMAYRQGLDRAVGTGPAPNLAQYQPFRSAWARNFDPDVYRFEDAQRRGDQAAIREIVKREGSAGMRELAAKSANLRMLENGQIPNG